MNDKGQGYSKYPVRVFPRPTFLGRHEGQYAFAYEITITNDWDRAVQLLNRHWIITHGDGSIEEVRGAGVVGQQPLLQPGQSFVYSSGAMIPTATGSMTGSYEFVTEAGEHFLTAIPEFVLAAPESLH